MVRAVSLSQEAPKTWTLKILQVAGRGVGGVNMLLITLTSLPLVTRSGIMSQLVRPIPKRNMVAVRRSTHLGTVLNGIFSSSQKGNEGVRAIKCHVRVCTKNGAHCTGRRTLGATKCIGGGFPSVPICARFITPE